MYNSVKDESLCQELGVDVLVAQILPEVDVSFGEHRRHVGVSPESAYRSGGDVNKRGPCLEAEVHATLRSAYVDILDIRAFGEVLDVSRTVDDSGDGGLMACG